MERTHGPEGSSPDGKTTWHRSPCLGLCERAPAALVLAAGERHSEQALAPCNAGEITTALQGERGFPRLSCSASVPQMGQPGLTLLRRVGQINPESLDEYRAAGGFTALRRALEMGPAAVVREVIESKLVGRGGAAFPCGQKWQSILSTALPRYLICNADESEPGTFKDRVLMEGDPYALIESMIIAGFRHRMRAGLPVHSRRVSAGPAPPGTCHSRVPRAVSPGYQHPRLWSDASTSSCGLAPGPTSAAKRRRS